jgi:hypothetical protein
MALIEQVQMGSTTLDINAVTSSMHNILHFVDKDNPRGPYPSNPASDGQYTNWEYAVQKWKEQTYAALLPTEPSTDEDEDRDQEAEDEEENDD